ncbi:MAG: GNAT family N-acetyltransferase [Dehalococcoidia bacterium]
MAGTAAVDRWDTEEGAAKLRRVAMASAHRGRGITARPVATAEQRAVDWAYSMMRLQTVSTMTAAISMYRGIGYRETAQRTMAPLTVLTFSKALRVGGRR